MERCLGFVSSVMMMMMMGHDGTRWDMMKMIITTGIYLI